MKKYAALLIFSFTVFFLASGWIYPIITPVCAPDEFHSEFVVRLEGDYGDIHLYRFDVAVNGGDEWVTYQGQKGDNKLVVDRVDSIAVRWTGDHWKISYATANKELCTPPTATPTATPTTTGTATQTPTSTATATSTPTPTPTSTATVTPVMETPTATLTPAVTPTIDMPFDSATPVPDEATMTPSPWTALPIVDEDGNPIHRLFLPNASK